MNLVEASLRFPTVVFSIGLCVALVYWLFVLIGALDLDLFGHGHADIAGAGKGVGDALGAAKGAGDAITGAKGGAEALKGAKLEGGDADGGVWAGLGLAKVPITISLSVVFLVCWGLCLAAMHYGPGAVGGARWLGPLVLLLALVVGLPIAGLLVRPLGRVFELHEGKSSRDYIGHTCTVTTGYVDEGFGQATIEDGGTVHTVAVRCDRAGALARNDKALIIDFDAERHVYLVEPAADVVPPAPDAAPDQTA